MREQANGLPSGFELRETAEGPTATATPPAPSSTGERTFTEGEAYALIADNVQRETAAKTAEIDQLKRENGELATKLEVADTAHETEKARADKAEADLKAIADETERQTAAAALAEGRVAKVKEAGPHLKDEFFTPERAARWSLMEEESFDAYVKEVAELAAGTTGAPAPTTSTTGAPRETAMQGAPVTGGGDKPKGLAALGGVFPTSKVGG